MGAQSLHRVMGMTLVMLTVCSPAWAIPSGGLVAYWPFSGNGDDVSGNGHHAFVYGATSTADRFGNPSSAYSFDGVDDYMYVPYAAAFQLQQFTLAVWIQTRGDLSPRSTSAVIVARGEDFSTDRLWSSVEIAGSHDPWGTGTLLIYEDNGDRECVYDTGVFPHPETWTQIAVTRSLAGEVIVYVNGDAVGHWYGTPTPATTCTQELTIGARWWSPSASGPYQLAGYFPGSIDDVMLYNRPLSAEEIRELAVVPVPSAALLAILGLSIAGRGVGRLTR